MLKKVDDAFLFQSQILWKAIESVSVDELRDGYKFEIGFSLFILHGSGIEYNVIVPDYTLSPFYNTTDDLTLAFLIHMEQVSMLQKYNIEGKSVRFDDEIVVASNALDRTTICLQRFKNLNGSGWCINEIARGDDGEYEKDKYKEDY